MQRLIDLKPGDQARLRQLAGEGLDHSLQGFDLFTGVWWSLRQMNQNAPERRSAWLVAKLFGSFPIPCWDETLAHALGRLEPRGFGDNEKKARTRYRNRFDALLLSPLSLLEPHLSWALLTIRREIGRKHQYVTTRHTFQIYGLCEECHKKNAARVV